jgi:hypothetical protein
MTHLPDLRTSPRDAKRAWWIVSGNAMEPTLRAGQRVYFEEYIAGCDVTPGDVYAATNTEGSVFFVGRVSYDPAGKLVCQPDNPACCPHVVGVGGLRLVARLLPGIAETNRLDQQGNV